MIPKHSKPRSVLTTDQAISIYALKPKLTTAYSERQTCAKLAEQHGVSPKTVRDIWSRRTWFKATHLFGFDGGVIDTERLQKHPGRPKGSKDKKPRRKPKLMQHQELKIELYNFRQIMQHTPQESEARWYLTQASPSIQVSVQSPLATYSSDQSLPYAYGEGSSESINVSVDDARSCLSLDAHWQQKFAFPLAPPASQHIHTDGLLDAIHFLDQDAQQFAPEDQRSPPPLDVEDDSRDPFHGDWPFWRLP